MNEKIANELAKWISAIMIFMSIFLSILGFIYLCRYLIFSWYVLGLAVLLICFIKKFLDGVSEYSGEEN